VELLHGTLLVSQRAKARRSTRGVGPATTRVRVPR
jgi:hypothetical protein